MNIKKYIINSISQVTSVNLFSMIVTAILTLVVPRYIGKYDYGLWQLFVFYQGYLGFFHFGWNDGIYLRYGGKSYSELNKKNFYSQFWLQMLLEIVVSAVLVAFMWNNNIDRQFIVWQIGINLIILNSRYMLLYILQTTARLKEYAIIMFVDRFFYLLFILLSLFLHKNNFRSLIWAETLSKSVAYIIAVYYCSDIVCRKISDFFFDVHEILQNLNVGIKLMFANIASILITGIVRWAIEKNWSVEVFGEISLTITLSQLFITFVTNIGIVIFPLLKKMNQDSLVKIYQNIKTVLTSVLFFILIFFQPGKLILINWLPNYTNSIYYMGLLLPICFYESKTALLNNTYLKAMRKEKEIMYINCCIMGLSLGFSLITSFILKNLMLSMLSITILLMLRCLWAEKIVYQELRVSHKVVWNWDNLIMVIFVFANYYVNGWKGFFIYLFAIIIYFLGKRKKIINSLQSFC